MRSMGGALPNYRSGVPSLESLHTQQRFHSNASSTPMHQHQQVSQLTGQPMGNSPGYSSGFAPQYMSSYHQGQQGTSGSQQYGQPQSGHQSRTIIPSPIQPPFPSGSFFPGQQSTQPYTYYSTSFGQTSPSQQGFQGSCQLTNFLLANMLTRAWKSIKSTTGESNQFVERRISLSSQLFPWRSSIRL